MTSEETARKNRATFLRSTQKLREELANSNLSMSSEMRKVKASCLAQSLFIMTSDTGIDPEEGLFEYAILFELASMRTLFNWHESHAA